MDLLRTQALDLGLKLTVTGLGRCGKNKYGTRDSAFMPGCHPAGIWDQAVDPGEEVSREEPVTLS